MQNPSEPRVRCSQRDYSLPFKLAVVGEVGRGELSYQQAQRRYGIQGRSTVLSWCRRYASQFVTFQAGCFWKPFRKKTRRGWSLWTKPARTGPVAAATAAPRRAAAWTRPCPCATART